MSALSWILIVVFAGSLAIAVGLSIALGKEWFTSLTWRGRALAIGWLVGTCASGVVLRARVDYDKEQTWSPNARVWPRVPLRVTSGADLRDWVPQLEAAMRMWNHAVGCELFEGADGGPADVRVVFTLEAPCNSISRVLDPRAAAATYYCSDGTADVEVQRIDTVPVAFRLFAHELGHVLGLGHDRNGLMAESIVTVEDHVAPSPKDREVVAAWYCTDGGVRTRAEAP